MFTDDYFGRVDPDLHTVTTGRWAYLEVPKSNVSVRQAAAIGISSRRHVSSHGSNHLAYTRRGPHLSPMHGPTPLSPPHTTVSGPTGEERVRPDALPVEHEQEQVPDALLDLLRHRVGRLLALLPHLRGRSVWTAMRPTLHAECHDP